MCEKKRIVILREEVVIPKEVQQKADAAFEQILAKPGAGKVLRLRQRQRRRAAAAAVAAVLALSTVAAGAAYLEWNKGLEKDFAVTEEQKGKAESTRLAGFPNLSAEDKGIVVTAQQSIVDNYYGYLAFKVEGFTKGKGREPGFNELSIKVDGKDISHTCELYGKEKMNKVNEDGSFECRIMLYGDDGKGTLKDKQIDVRFSDLGVVTEKAGAAEDVVNGEWAFSWQLSGSDEIYTAEVDEKLGSSGAAVTRAEVSPISIKAVYDFPARTVKEEAFDETSGEVYETDMLDEPPLLIGVRLKDGTLVTDTQGGTMGYTDGGKRVYEECFAMGKILDVEEVESLLFVKKIPEEERELTEEDMFVVKVR